MTSVHLRCRELAERSSNGTKVRLLWRQGTRQLWVEVRERDDRVLEIAVQRSGRFMPSITRTPTLAPTVPYQPVQSLAPRERRSQAADRHYREQ